MQSTSLTNKRLIILDRDGVINEDSDAYIKSVAEWIPITHSIAAIAKLKQAGYQVAIATNQSGIARGYYHVATLHAIHDYLAKLLAVYAMEIDMIVYCPHRDDDQCSCRKPKAGMLLNILSKCNVRAEQAIMVGDSITDWQAAQAAHVDYIQVRTGKGERTIASGALPASVACYTSLADFVSQSLRKTL